MAASKAEGAPSAGRKEEGGGGGGDLDRHLINSPLFLPFLVTSVAHFVNKSPRHTHEWLIHIGGTPRSTSQHLIDTTAEAQQVKKRRRCEEATSTGGTGSEAGGLFEELVSKVVFRLDKSFAVPVRTVTEPPFMTHGEGWGEHCVEIDVHFLSEFSLPTFTARHLVMLHNTIPTPLSLSSETALLEPPPQRLVLPDDPNRPCVSQRRDSIVISNPTHRIYHRFLLAANHQLTCKAPTQVKKEDDEDGAPRAFVRGYPYKHLPPLLESVLRNDHERAAEIRRMSETALDQALASLQREEADLLAQIAARKEHTEWLLEKGQARLMEQQQRCDRLEQQHQ